ncbi:MAG: hypothetical protein GY845_33875 [Planctomycetes bacterium]|nr:hypothetical protein [Planctomycetota bacterium]
MGKRAEMQFTKLNGKSELDGKKSWNKNGETTASDILNNPNIMQINDSAAKVMLANREILKQEMSLDEEDIIDLPVVFMRTKGIPVWPNPINGLMMSNHYILSCPHGSLKGQLIRLKIQ